MGRTQKRNQTKTVSAWKSRHTIKTRLVVAHPEDSLARGVLVGFVTSALRILFQRAALGRTKSLATEA